MKAHAQVFRWDNGNLIAGTYNTPPVPGANYASLNLSFAALSSANLTSSNLRATNLTSARLASANFTGANLFSADFFSADLTGANLTDAFIRGASFSLATGFTAAQLYSTSSYKSRDLAGFRGRSNNYTGWNFANQRLETALLTSANFTSANLSRANLFTASLFSSNFTSANLADAFVEQADFSNTTSRGFVASQLYSTASYKSRNLRGLKLFNNNLTGWSFASQEMFDSLLNNANLTSANLASANLTAASLFQANLTGANLAGALIGAANLTDVTGFTRTMFESTASYLTGDLERVSLGFNNHVGWSFADKVLTSAYLVSSVFNSASFARADLFSADLSTSSFIGADFSSAFLANAVLRSSTLSGANFTGAVIRGAALGTTVINGFTAAQLYSTASYQARDLSGVFLPNNDLTAWDFSRQLLLGTILTSANLTSANFASADLRNAQLFSSTLTSANFTDAHLYSTLLYSTNLSAAQLYSTASYKAFDLRGTDLRTNNLTGWNLRSQNLSDAQIFDANLTSADFTSATLIRTALFRSTLTGAVFTDAVVRDADIGATTSRNFTSTQLYSTASYKARDLIGLKIADNNLSAWDFSSQYMGFASLTRSTLVGTLFTSANLTSANLSSSNLTNASFRSAILDSADFRSSTFSPTTDLTDARIPNASLGFTTSRGFTAAHLYSTLSYKTFEIPDLGMTSNNLNGWNFVSQNLASTAFLSTTLVSTDFTLADLRGSTDFVPVATTRTRGTILPNATVSAFTFDPDEALRLRAHPLNANLNATITGPATGSATVSLDPTASASLAPAPLASSSVRTLDRVNLVMNGLQGGNSTLRVTPVTVTNTGRTTAPLLTVLSSLSMANDNAPLGARTYRALLDLGTNDAVVLNGTSSLPNLRDMARAFLASPAQGVGSSSSLPFTRLAVTLNADRHGLPLFPTFNGLPVSTADVLIKFTWTGDVNLDGLLDARDYTTVLANFSAGRTNATWLDGDINYDGLVNASDWSLFLPAYTAFLANPRPFGSPRDFAVPSGSVIPEPALLAPAYALIVMGLRRRTHIRR